MRWVGLAAVLLATASAVGSEADSALREAQAGGAVSPGDPGEIWRQPYRCAPNTLYLLLRITGVPCDYHHLERLIPVTKDGARMADMRRCAEALGLRARVYKWTPERLMSAPLPLIAHTEEKGVIGHYVVIVAVGADKVELIDGTTAMEKVVTLSDFRKAWSGYVLVVSQPSWGRRLLPALIVLGVAMSLFAGTVWKQTPRSVVPHLTGVQP